MTCERFHGPSRKLQHRSHRGFFRNRLSLIGVILIFALAGCETTPKPVPPAAPTPPEVVSLKKLSPSSYPNFADDLDYDSLGQRHRPEHRLSAGSAAAARGMSSAATASAPRTF